MLLLFGGEGVRRVRQSCAWCLLAPVERFIVFDASSISTADNTSTANMQHLHHFHIGETGVP